MKDTLTSVEHALDILEAFCIDSAALSVAEISAVTQLHKSSVYRLIKVLLKRGYLDHDEKPGKYRLGIQAISLASNRINDMELVSEAHPILLRLHSETMLAVQLCVLDGTDVIYLDEVTGSKARKFAHMGYRGEAFCSSLGKCLLAALSGEELAHRFSSYHFSKYTDTTISSFPALKSELKIVRRRGYATQLGERDPLLASIACPIYDYSGSVVAAISIGGAKYLFADEMIEKLLAHLQRYAIQLSKNLGYNCNETIFF